MTYDELLCPPDTSFNRDILFITIVWNQRCFSFSDSFAGCSRHIFFFPSKIVEYQYDIFYYLDLVKISVYI